MKTLLPLLFVVASLPTTLRDYETPLRVTMNPVHPSAGQSVTITVELTGEVADDQPVEISASSTYWSVMPSSVVIASGYAIGSFSATIQTTPTGTSTVTASCNGGTASASVPEN